MRGRRGRNASRGPRPDAAGRIGGRWLLAVFVVAFAYRGVCFSVMGDHPLFRHPVVDAEHHDAWARRIAAGDWLGHGPDDAFKPPLYAYLLAGLYSVAGRSVAFVQWTQHLLGACSCVLLAVLAARLLGPRVGRVAGLLGAAYAPFVFFESQLLTPAVSIVLNLGAALLLTPSGEERPGSRRLLGVGALLGLSAGVRPDVLLPAFLVLLWLVVRHRHAGTRRLATGALCLAGAAAAVVAPITVRNVRLTGQLIPIASNAGINLYVGNSAGRDGTTAVPVGLRWERLVARVPQEVLERPATASRWWARAAWDDVRSAPGRALGRLGAKAVAFWNRREFRNNVCYHFAQRLSWPLRWCPFQFALVVPLAACGLVGLWRGGGARERRAAAFCALWVGGYWAVGVAFFVTARFRLPAVPFLMIPAAWGATQIAGALRHGPRRALLAQAAIVLAAGVLAWPPWFGPPRHGWARDHVNLGNSLREAGDRRGAGRAYRQALAIEPSDPDAHYLLARLLAPTRPAQALEHLAAARASAPDSPDVLLAAAETHLALGDTALAREALGALVRLADTSNLWPRRAAWATAHVLLARIEPAAARQHWDKAWAIHPHTAAEAAFLERRELPRVLKTFEADAREKPWDLYAQFDHGMALLETGRPDEAVGPLRRAARLAPGRAFLRYHLARALVQAGRAEEAAGLLDRLDGELGPGALREQVGALRKQIAR